MTAQLRYGLLNCYTGEPQLIVNPSSPVSVTGGSSVTLECTAAGSPPPVVQWIIEGHHRSNLQIRETNRGVLKLIIENVRPEDQGNFTCQAENIVGLTQESVQLTGIFLMQCNGSKVLRNKGLAKCPS